MNKELKDKWIKALRSGEYKQAKYLLEQLDINGNVLGNCCLGVLCRVAGIEAIKDLLSHASVFDGHEGVLSEELEAKLQVPPKIAEALASMNDRRNKNFNEIADYIEINL